MNTPGHENVEWYTPAFRLATARKRENSVLRDAKVEYLAWARDAQRAPRRVSLLLSGCDTPLDRIPFRTEDLENVVPPAYEDSRLLEGLAARYGVPADEVFPCLGTSQALFLALAGLLSPGDGVLVEQPGYESVRRVSEAFGASVRTFTRDPESGFAILPETVLEAWQPHVRVVALSDLHNPTGSQAGDEALARLAETLRERRTMLLVDEVYRDFRPGPLGTARTLNENVVILSSFTKVYGLGNLRAGWILGPRELVERLAAMMDVMESIGPTPAQAYFRRAFEVLDELRNEALAKSRAGWSVVEAWAREEPRVRVTAPAGGLIAWVRLPERRTGSEVARRLLEDHDVAVVPGRFFGDDTGIRIGFGGAPQSVAAGLEALSRVL